MASVLFLHGTFSAGRMWRRYAQAIAPVPSAAPDLLGAGGSDPVTLQDAWTIDAELGALEPALKALPGPVTLVAHSFGGALGLLLAERHPERVVQALIHEPLGFPLLTSPEDRALLPQSELDPFLDVSRAGSEAWVEGVVDFWSGPGTWDAMPPAHKAGALALSGKAFHEVRFGITSAVPPEVLARIRIPVTLTVGEDGPPPEHRVVERMADLLPQGRRAVIPGGHNAPLTHPAAFAGLLRGMLGEG